MEERGADSTYALERSRSHDLRDEALARFRCTPRNCGGFHLRCAVVGRMRQPVAQAEFECGPAALAMAITAAGTPITPEALVPQVCLPARKGTLQVEMPVAVRRAGLLAYTLAPELQAVLREVAAGNPCWFSSICRCLGIRCGTTQRMPISFSAFERTWARANYWAMVALQPKRMPATADATRLATATVAQPDFADAWNNLAIGYPQSHRLGRTTASRLSGFAEGHHSVSTTLTNCPTLGSPPP